MYLILSIDKLTYIIHILIEIIVGSPFRIVNQGIESIAKSFPSSTRKNDDKKFCLCLYEIAQFSHLLTQTQSITSKFMQLNKPFKQTNTYFPPRMPSYCS